MSKKSVHPKISIYSASQRASLNSNVKYITVMSILVHTKILTRSFIACTLLDLLLVIIVLIVSIKFKELTRKQLLVLKQLMMNIKNYFLLWYWK